jgi:hypothetical protein
MSLSSFSSLRQRQIESLQSIAHRQVSADLFEIPVSLPLGTLYVRLFLPSDFPQGAPVLEVPHVTHPWVDRNGKVVGHKGLTNWEMSHSLQRVVNELLEELVRRPPTRTNSNKIPHLTNTPHFVLPSHDQIEHLINDKFARTDFIESAHQNISDMLRFKTEIIFTNAKLATDNLDLYSKLTKLHEEITKIRNENEHNYALINELFTNTRKESLRFKPDYLKIKIDELINGDDSCEVVKDSYLNREINDDEFMLRFRSSSFIKHSRMAKRELLQYI